MSEEEYSVCKVYGSKLWHDSIDIVADERALLELRAAIDEALNSGFGDCDMMESDGEGYNVFIYKEERTWEEWCKLPTHYTDKSLTGGHPTEEEIQEFLDIINKWHSDE